MCQGMMHVMATKTTARHVIQRRKVGKKFYYVYGDSVRLTDTSEVQRINSLAIPPAWRDVEIAKQPGAKVQVTGYDAAGRKQYIYHKRFREQQERKKFDRILAFANALPMMRKITGEHLRLPGMPREKVLACMVRLIDQAYFRVGNEQYAKENQTFGLSTLRSRHLSIEGDTMVFEYTGKSNQEQYREVTDPRLAKIVAELDDLPGYEIFKYRDDTGALVDVKSQDVNSYIKDIMGSDYSAKDFRTWAGTLIAAVALAEMELPTSQTAAKRHITKAVKHVATMLGNTPAIAKASYIDPRVLDHYLSGSTITWYLRRIQTLLKDTGSEHLSHEEVAVLKLLKRRLKKTSAARR